MPGLRAIFVQFSAGSETLLPSFLHAPSRFAIVISRAIGAADHVDVTCQAPWLCLFSCTRREMRVRIAPMALPRRLRVGWIRDGPRQEDGVPLLLGGHVPGACWFGHEVASHFCCGIAVSTKRELEMSELRIELETGPLHAFSVPENDVSVKNNPLPPRILFYNIFLKTIYLIKITPKMPQFK